MSGDRPTDLAELRRRIQRLDRVILEAAVERTRLARTVAEVKMRDDLPAVDYAQERRILENARSSAKEQGIEPELAEDLLARLIQASVTVQEAQRLEHAGTGEGQVAVVVGGAGRMGRWIVRFMQAQRFQVHVIDPQAPHELDRDGRRVLPRADWIICSAPPRATVDFYRQLLHAPPSGMVADIASIKSPLIEPIEALRDAGVSVGSFHPMFGPATVVLRGEDVVVCDTGDAKALAAIERLFEPTLARLVFVDLERHDRLMAEVLALAHATTMAFSTAQAEVEIPPVHSTTYRILEDLAGSLAQESPDVYFEIQSDNPHAARAVERLARAVSRILEVVEARDRRGFEELMGGSSDGSGKTSEKAAGATKADSA